MLDRELVQVFLEEAVDLLDAWERHCLALESEPSPANMASLARVAHSIKGAAGAVGLLPMSNFVHSVEDLMMACAKERLPVTPAVIDCLLRCHLALADWIGELHSDPEHVGGVEELQAELARVLAAAAPAPAAAPGERPAGRRISARMAHAAAARKQALIPERPAADEAPEGARTAVEPQQQAQLAEQSIRVSAAAVDELVQLIGELTIQHRMIDQFRAGGRHGDPVCLQALDLGGKLCRELHEKSLTLRMQPLGGLFQRLERAARDVARRGGKSVTVVMHGAEVPLDRRVIEGIADPLMHTVRNAVDHGLETPEQRAAGGKKETGEIVLSAMQTPAGVVVEVSDDGRGLDQQAILAAAIRKGLVEESQELTSAQVRALIFEPGFSTAGAITEISGRGVGLDVVARAVQALRGTVELETRAGSGTTFRFLLPATLGILDALIVRSDRQHYAVPLHEVEEVVDLADCVVQRGLGGSIVADLRGEFVPVTPLSGQLQTHLDTEAAGRSHPALDCGTALLARDGRHRVAFQVDVVIAQQQVVVRQLHSRLCGVPGLSASTILTNGEPGLILDLPALARRFLKTKDAYELRG